MSDSASSAASGSDREPLNLPRKVQAFVRGREVLVWRAEDVVLLRRRWRVVGGAIGALPLQPRQNACLGLPLLLSPEEATLLLEQGVLELREYSTLALQTLGVEPGQFQQLRAEDFQRQLVAYQEKRERAKLQFAQPRRGSGLRIRRREIPTEEGGSGEGGAEQEDVSARKKARLRGGTELGTEGQGHGSVVASGGNSDVPTHSVRLELRTLEPDSDQSGKEKLQKMARDQRESEDVGCYGNQSSHEREAGGGSLVRPSHNIGAFSPLVCIHLADPRVELCPSCFKPAQWSFPQTELQVLNYRVFRDLWEKGYYLTSGLKYGGDFLVYPGDPSLVHSHYIAVVLPWQQPIRDLVALGRLGAKVKKNVLLCSVDPQGAIQYFTWHWTGF